MYVSQSGTQFQPWNDGTLQFYLQYSHTHSRQCNRLYHCDHMRIYIRFRSHRFRVKKEKKKKERWLFCDQYISNVHAFCKVLPKRKCTCEIDSRHSLMNLLCVLRHCVKGIIKAWFIFFNLFVIVTTKVCIMYNMLSNLNRTFDICYHYW